MSDASRLTAINSAIQTRAHSRLTRRRLFWLGIGLCLAL